MKRSFILCCFLCIVAAGSFTTVKAQAINTTDSLALVDFYKSTNGNTWYVHDNWLTINPVSTWYGITVTGDRVTSLTMYFNNVSGKLPSSIGNITGLVTLSLTFNSIGGVLPSSIGNLTNLVYLELIFTQIGGNIPKSIGNLKNLYNLYLEQSAFAGTIPASIGSMTNLRDLNLNGNQLTGSIPPEIGNLPSITNLDLSSNGISGTIPPELGKLKTLQNLVFYRDQLSGEIPAALGNLEQLTGLGLHYNHLSGEIPASIGKLKNLRILNLQYNQLTGAIPASFSQLSNLTNIDVSYNKLTNDKNISSSEGTTSTYVTIDHNRFTFNGVEFIAQHYKRRAYYAPQDTILPIHQHNNRLSVSAGGTLSNNTYKWFKVGQSTGTTITGDSIFLPTQNGKYYAQITNVIATQLTLTTDTITYTVPLAKASFGADAVVATNATTYFSVYPNPAKDIIHLQTNGTASITITNAAGKIILSKNIKNNGNINVSAFANGVYYVQNKTIGEVQKIVVLH